MTDDMDGWDFIDLADELVTSLGDRIPGRERALLRRDIDELIQVPKIFMRNFVGLLIDEQTPLTARECVLVRRLMKHRRMDMSLASQLNTVDPTEDRNSPSTPE